MYNKFSSHLLDSSKREYANTEEEKRDNSNNNRAISKEVCSLEKMRIQRENIEAKEKSIGGKKESE